MRPIFVPLTLLLFACGSENDLKDFDPPALAGDTSEPPAEEEMEPPPPPPETSSGLRARHMRIPRPQCSSAPMGSGTLLSLCLRRCSYRRGQCVSICETRNG